MSIIIVGELLGLVKVRDSHCGGELALSLGCFLDLEVLLALPLALDTGAVVLVV